MRIIDPRLRSIRHSALLRQSVLSFNSTTQCNWHNVTISKRWRSKKVFNTRLPTSFLKQILQSRQPAIEMVVPVTLVARSDCSETQSGGSSLTAPLPCKSRDSSGSASAADMHMSYMCYTWGFTHGMLPYFETCVVRHSWFLPTVANMLDVRLFHKAVGFADSASSICIHTSCFQNSPTCAKNTFLMVASPAFVDLLEVSSLTVLQVR